MAKRKRKTARKTERRKKRSFSAEFKAEATRMVLEEGLTVAQAARDLDLTESSLRNWVRQAEVDAGRGATGALTSEEQEELRRLRKENKRLRMEREILKKAAAFFAKENS
jgi:transposase-like protein